MLIDLLIVIVKIAIMLAFVLGLVPVLVWAERKGAAFIQDRMGPAKADIFGLRLAGLFHPLADALKLLFKEDFVPEDAHPLFYRLAPVFAMAPVLLTFAVVPFGDTIEIFGRKVPLQVADLNVGILYVFAFSSLTVYGIILAGWASGNKFSLLGGLRSSAQMISYEISLGLSIIGVAMVFGSLKLSDIARAQGELLFGVIPKWGVVVQPLGFILFLVSVFAESARIPFDLPEGESEIVAGFHTEYGSFKFAMFFLAEYVHVVVASGLIATLYFGGWQIPYLYADGFHLFGKVLHLPFALVVIMQVLAFVVKVLFFCWFFIWVRWTIPRFRYDQVMRLGWKVLLPLALANIFITGSVLLLFGGAKPL
ncbi:MAG: NADH-quinone oxidoreductase subunit NuoH [Deltaproteobacteria bacterium]|nr:MAG: NADH-quinone oxidoreductase subunit NuoH [Deltaproteobacteria bacterium]